MATKYAGYIKRAEVQSGIGLKQRADQLADTQNTTGVQTDGNDEQIHAGSNECFTRQSGNEAEPTVMQCAV